MSTLSVETSVRPRNRALRIGLVLAGVLAALDVVTGVLAMLGGFFAPAEVGIVIMAIGVITLVLVPLAWNGRRGPALTTAALRILSGATGLPAFFVPGVPTEAIVAAAVGILVSVLCAWLIAVGLRKNRS